MGEKERATTPLTRQGGETHEANPTESSLLAHEVTHTAQQGSGSARERGSSAVAESTAVGGGGALDDPSGLAVWDEGKGGQKDPPKTK